MTMLTMLPPDSTSRPAPATAPTPARPAPERTRAEVPQAECDPAEPGGRKKVLIVDDNPDASDPLARLLSRLGLVAICAHSGPDALALLDSDLPDLMILDVMMPGMDGIEVLKRVRDNPRTADLPVVMFSAIADREFQASALRQGANDYWVKASLDFGKIRGTLGSLL